MAAPTQTPEVPVAFARRVALSRSEVAALLGRSERFVDSLVSDGTLRSKRVRRTVFIIAADLWRLLGLGDKPEISDRARDLLREMG